MTANSKAILTNLHRPMCYVKPDGTKVMHHSMVVDVTCSDCLHGVTTGYAGWSSIPCPWCDRWMNRTPYRKATVLPADAVVFSSLDAMRAVQATLMVNRRRHAYKPYWLHLAPSESIEQASAMLAGIMDVSPERARAGLVDVGLGADAWPLAAVSAAEGDGLWPANADDRGRIVCAVGRLCCGV